MNDLILASNQTASVQWLVGNWRISDIAMSDIAGIQQPHSLLLAVDVTPKSEPYSVAELGQHRVDPFPTRRLSEFAWRGSGSEMRNVTDSRTLWMSHATGWRQCTNRIDSITHLHRCSRDNTVPLMIEEVIFSLGNVH